MNYTQAEADIVAKLAVLEADGHVVVPLPESPAEFKRPFHKVRITVGYAGSSFGNNGSLLSTAEISQEETAEFTVSIQSRFLRGELGIHTFVSTVKKILLGFMPTDGGRLFIKGADFADPPLEEGLWTFNICFGSKTRAVQDEKDTDLDGANITQINFDDVIYYPNNG